MFSSKQRVPPPSYDTKFDAMTLYASFTEEVLLLTPPSNRLRPPMIVITKKGASTQEALPPAVWFPRKEEDYVQRASGAIDIPHIQAQLQSSYLPAPYSPCILNSETDIVQASVLWLLHPVIKALQALFPRVECAAEVTIGDCRCDALISIAGQTIAVLEYKNRGNIERRDFFEGMIQNFGPSNRMTILNAIDTAKERTRLQSHMGNNATCLTKQAMAYATKWETRYVGLFDWDQLFLWNFAGMDFAPANPSPWAFGTWVEQRSNFRSALLGFILCAYENKARNPRFKKGMEAPYELTKAQKEALRQKQLAKQQQNMTEQQKANRSLYLDNRR